MLALYLFSLVVGGGLLLLTFASLGADGDASAHHDPPGGAVPSDGHPHDWMAARDFLSLRSFLYFLAGFGATGALLEVGTSAPAGVALAWAGGAGVTAAFAAGALYAWVRRSESGLIPTEADYLIGVPGRVMVPLQPGQRGKILAQYGGRRVELLARLFRDDDLPCARGDEVVIVELDGDTALVAPLPSLPSGSLLE